MAEIFDLDATAANNTARFPENMQFRNVNDSARELEAMIARDFKDRNMSLASSGSSNAFAVTSNRTITSYTDNLEIGFTANHTITGAATLNLNGLGVKAIVSNDDSPLASGDIVSGQRLRVVYRSSQGNFQLVGPARSSTADVPSTRTLTAAGLVTGGGDLSANRTFTVTEASQAEAEAGTASTVAMTPRRTKQAIDALALSNIVFDTYPDNTSLSTAIPVDDTIPQNTEGTEILSVTITPTSASKNVRLTFQGFGGGINTSAQLTAALFKNSDADAINATTQFAWSSGIGNPVIGMHITHVDSPATTSATTYTIRVGPVSSTMRMNGPQSGRFFGGAAAATLVAEEID